MWVDNTTTCTRHVQAVHTSTRNLCHRKQTDRNSHVDYLHLTACDQGYESTTTRGYNYMTNRSVPVVFPERL